MKNIISILLISCATLYSFSQQIKVQGKVTDALTDEPLPGVNIVVEGTNQGIITDIDGRYSIVVDDKNHTLKFSFMGYLQENVLIGEQQIINVSLFPDIKALEEIIVIGYGSVKKADATGSVSVVSNKDFNKGTINSVQELLIGKSAGVVISTNSGAPGNASTIRIRGGSSLSASNDPLIVIDGVPLDNSGLGGSPNILATLNPNDIETFTILKDASATAIFGSRAANGVILITTKRGTKEFKVNYTATLSLATVPKKVDVYSGDEYRAMMNEKYEGNDAVL
jgi:iron complex outermembrane receptor protein